MENKVLKPKIRFKGFTDTWEQRKVGEFGELITGTTPSTSDVNNYNGDYLFVSPADIQGNRFVKNTITTLSEKGFCKCRRLKADSVLFVSIGSTIGKVAQIKEIAVTNQQINAIIPNEKYNPNFVYSLLENKAEDIKKQASAQAVPIINKTTFGEIECFVTTSKEEQTKISKILLNIDNLITLHQSKYDKLVNVKKALLEKMFPKDGKNVPEIRFKGFTDTWEQHKFSRLANVRRGLTYSPIDISKNGVRVLRSSNIQEDKFIYSEDDVFVNKNAINIDYVKNNDILITSANGSTRLVGKHALISGLPSSSAVHGGFMLLATGIENPEFLNASMSSSWYSKFIELFVSGGNGAIGNLSKSDLDEQEILVPSSEEQKKLGQLFKMIDNLITLHQHKLEKLKNMKKSLLNKMFI